MSSPHAAMSPNPIGLSIVKMVSCEGNILHLEGVDALDGTPLLGKTFEFEPI